MKYLFGGLLFCCLCLVFADTLTLEDYFSAEELERSRGFYNRYDMLTLWSKAVTYISIFILLLTPLHLVIDRKLDAFYDKTFGRISFGSGLKLDFGLLPRLFVKIILWICLMQFYWDVMDFPISYYNYHLRNDFGMVNKDFWGTFVDSYAKYWFTIFKIVAWAVLFLTFYNISTRFWWVFYAILWLIFSVTTDYFSQAAFMEKDGAEIRKPLEEGSLRTKLEAAIAKSGVTINEIKITDESTRTKTTNAWILSASDQNILFFTDNCLAFSDEELVNMALHEIGHVYYNHNQIRRIYSRVMFFVQIFIISLFIRFYIRKRYKDPSVVEGKGQTIVYFIFTLLIGKLVSFSIAPGYCLMHQYQELEAERYAINITHQPDSMIHLRKAMAVEALIRLDKPYLPWWFQYPFIIEFFQISEEFKKKNGIEDKNKDSQNKKGLKKEKTDLNFEKKNPKEKSK